MGEMRNTYKILVGKPEGIELGSYKHNGSILLKWALYK
jgi:hypothetical protein